MMSNTPTTESQVVESIRGWYAKLDKYPDFGQMLSLVADKVVMNMAERKFEWKFEDSDRGAALDFVDKRRPLGCDMLTGISSLCKYWLSIRRFNTDSFFRGRYQLPV